MQGRHLRGLGAVAPSPQGKRKKEKRKNKKWKKERKKEENYMNTVKLLHIGKVLFFQFFNSPVALKIYKKIGTPRKKLK